MVMIALSQSRAKDYNHCLLNASSGGNGCKEREKKVIK
jgi:hypothetical protein